MGKKDKTFGLHTQKIVDSEFKNYIQFENIDLKQSILIL